MIATDIRVEDTADGSALAASVVIEGTGERFPLRSTYRGVPPGSVSGRGDALFAALYPLSLALGEDLRVDAPVSEVLLARAEDIGEIYRSFKNHFADWKAAWQRPDSRPRVVAAAEPTPGTGDGVGLLFTCGVDSFYSLLRRMDDPSARPVTHLLFVDGYEHRLQHRPLFHQVLSSVERVSDETGARLVLVETNLQRLSDRHLPWAIYHGAALASVGLALAPLSEVVIGSTRSFGELAPWGSHPLLDPMWSTEATEVVHHGCEARRAEKIWSAVAGSDVALRTLQVCCTGKGTDYNCGRCGKCVATMTALRAGDALERAAAFPKLTPALVRGTHLRANDVRVMEDAVTRLEELGRDQALARAGRAAARKVRLRGKVEAVRRRLLPRAAAL